MVKLYQRTFYPHKVLFSHLVCHILVILPIMIVIILLPIMIVMILLSIMIVMILLPIMIVILICFLYSYWIFDKFVKVRGPRPLSQLNFGSQLKKPNAALLYPNRQIYLFKNGKYYRYDHYNRRIASGYPREMHGTWRGVPNDITAAVTVTNSQVYFFKGEYILYLQLSARKLT